MTNRTVFGISISYTSISLINQIYLSGAITYFYLRNLGLDIRYQVVAWAIFCIWNAVDNLIAGSISDRSKKHKLGRRIPYLRVAAPLMSLFFCLSFFKLPFVISQISLAISFLLILSLLDFSLSFLEIAIYSLPLEESLSEKDRSKVFITEAILSIISFLVTSGLIPLIQPDIGADTTFFVVIMCMIGILCGVAVFIASFVIEHSYNANTEALKKIPISTLILSCLKNKTYIVAQCFGVIIMVIYTIYTIGIFYYLDELANDVFFEYIAFIIGAVLSVYVYKKFHSKISIKRLTSTSCFVVSAFMLTGFAIKGSIGGSLAFVAAGACLVIYSLNFSIIFGDVIDQDECKSGLRKDGTFFGLDCLFSSISYLAQSLFLIIIVAFGYVEHQAAGTQTLSAINGIWLAWLLPTAILSILAGVLLERFYPLGKVEIEEMKCTLQKNRTEMKSDGLQTE